MQQPEISIHPLIGRLRFNDSLYPKHAQTSIIPSIYAHYEILLYTLLYLLYIAPATTNCYTQNMGATITVGG